MDKTPRFHPNPDLKLMDQVCEVLRYGQYAYRTEQTYCQWSVRYIRFQAAKPTRHGWGSAMSSGFYPTWSAASR